MYSFLIWVSSLLYAEQRFVAVLETKKEPQAKLNASELRYLTDELRKQALQALPVRLGYTVMTRENIQAMLPPNTQIEDCMGDCLVQTGKNIGADYVAQARVGQFGSQLTLTVEMYETRQSRMLSSFTTEQENAAGLLARIRTESPEFFSKVSGGNVLGQNAYSMASTRVDEVGVVVTFELTDGAAAVLVNNKVACANKETCSKELSKGKHNITVSRDSYRDSSFEITVPNGSNRYKLALQSKTGVLTLRAKDSESGEDLVAQVVVDGRVVGSTPWSGAVALNVQTIQLKCNGYTEAVVSDRPEEGAKRQVVVKLQPKAAPVEKKQEDGPLYGSFIDSRDGKTYKTVTIGGQTWMAQNLNYGTMVSSEKDQNNDSKVEKYCYGNDADNCTTDGGLYQWAEAMALPSTCNKKECHSKIKSVHQGICPSGWHVPKRAETDLLATYLGGESVAGKKMKLNNGDDDWDATLYNDGNSSGFSALPAGSRGNRGGFLDRGSSAYFWEASESSASSAYFRYLYSGYASCYAYNSSKTNGFSLRCARD